MKHTVYVYAHHRDPSRHALPLVLGYLRYQTANACVHDVEAEDGRHAKQVAEREHRVQCLPIAERVPTHPNGHVGGAPCTCGPTILPVPAERRVAP